MKLKPDATVLLVIDMEKAFVEPGAALCIAGAKATVPVLAKTIDTARAAGIPVIWVKRIHAADGSDMEIPRRADLVRRGLGDAGVLAPGSTGLHSIEEPDGLVRLPEEEVLIKKRFSAFFGTGLAEKLKERQISTVILTGTTTPNCIRATCVDAISHNFRTIILEPCCSSATEEIQKANMEDMARIGAEIWQEI